MTSPRSQAGDAIRAGRAGSAETDTGLPRIELQFEARADGCLHCLVARVLVGLICPEENGTGRPGFNWLCVLPGSPDKAKFAATLDKAKDAMRGAVAEWCEAANLAPRPKRERGAVRAWRGGAR